MKRLVYLSLVVLIFLFSSCKREEFSQNNNLEITSTNYSSKGEFYEYNLEIPQIENSKSEDTTYFNLTMQENMRYILDNLSTKVGDSGVKKAVITFKNNKNNFGVLSITVFTQIESGTTNNLATLDSYNIALKDQAILTFDKIFKDDGVDYINMLINDSIRKKDSIVNTQGQEVIFFENAEADINNATLSFEGNNVVFTFAIGDLAPNSSGMPVFKFDKKTLKKYLNI